MAARHHRKILQVVAALFVFLLTAGSAFGATLGERVLYWGTSGEDVTQLQQKLQTLQFYQSGIDGEFGYQTSLAVKKFQRNNGLVEDGIVGTKTVAALKLKVPNSNYNTTYTIQKGDTLWSIAQKNSVSVDKLIEVNKISGNIIYPGQTLIITSISNNNTSEASRGNEVTYGEFSDWWTVASKIYARGDIATVTDLATGKSFKVKRLGGTNHADSEPLTVQDTAIMKEIYGGSWSWVRRAIIVTVDGHRIAASMNGMPHSVQNISNNNFPGHFCIHFLNSRTHGSNRVDEGHQAAVKQAAGIK